MELGRRLGWSPLPLTVRDARSMVRRQPLLLALLGLLFYAATQGAQFLSLFYLRATTVSLLLSFSTILVAFLGLLLLRERPVAVQWGGLALYLAGLGIGGLAASPLLRRDRPLVHAHQDAEQIELVLTYDDKLIGVQTAAVYVGPAGENGVPFAVLLADDDATGSNGLASVMGSKKLKAIVLRVDSPGGGVAPSQEIYREIQRTTGDKPVIVSSALRFSFIQAFLIRTFPEAALRRTCYA